MVDLGRLPAAVAAGPTIAVQDSTAEQRMDSPLGGVPGSGVPVEKWVGEIRNHSLETVPRKRFLS
jgi:hypothetical protein